MKRIATVAALLCAASAPGALAAGGTVSAVTVYPQLATVERAVSLDSADGEGRLTVRGISSKADLDSLRVRDVPENVRILSVSAESVPLAEASGARTADLRDRIESLRQREDALSDKLTAIDQRVSFLKRVSDSFLEALSTEGPDAFDWSASGGRVASELEKALSERRETDSAREDVRRKIDAIQEKLTRLRDGSEATPQVEIKLSGSAEGEITLAYNVREVSWRPSYAARLDTEDGTLRLSENAVVEQNTGSDWRDVSIALSTARPSGGASAPNVRPWRVRTRGGDRSSAFSGSGQGQSLDMAMPESQKVQPTQSRSDRARVRVTGFTTSYDVEGRVDLPAGKRKEIAISTRDMDAEVSLFAAPALDERAYLSAEFQHEGEAPMLPGRVQLYRDGAFAGEARFATLRPGGSRTLSFGPDPLVSVERKTVEKVRENTGLVSSYDKHVRRYETVVENGHELPVSLTLVERLPVSSDENVEVELSEWSTSPDQRRWRDRQGVMAWDLALQPQETAKVRFGFSLEHKSQIEVPGFR